MSLVETKSRLMRVILSPHVSDKAYRIGDKHNQYVLKVVKDATKPEIKKAVELLFEVKVKSVTTLVMKGKSRRFGKITGRTKDWKKAYVTLHEGSELNFGDGE